MPKLNPYSVSSAEPLEEGWFADRATRRQGGFLFRKLDISHPFAANVLYSGWWFRQKIEFNGHVVWWRISWLWIKKSATFRLPAEVDTERRDGKIEIDFSRGLRIRRFRLWIDEEVIYDEVAQ